MKQIAKDEVINYQLSNVEFHFETLHPFDNEYMLESGGYISGSTRQ